jgi:hypothetical protein
MKKVLLSLLAITSLQCAIAQILFIDSFLYNGGVVLGGNGGWTQTTSGAGGPTLVNANGLIYPNYSNALSGCAEIFTNGNPGDVVYNTLSTPISSGTVYASFAINITTAPTTSSNPYCIALGDQASFGYGARLVVKPSGAGFVKLGTRKENGSDVYSTIDYPINTVHLVILKYVFNTSSTTDDECKMFVNPINFTAEPATAEANASAGTDFAGTIKHFIIRNNGGANTPSAKIDEVHVGKTWADLFVKPVVIPNAINNNILNNFTIIPNPSNGNIQLNNIPANAATINAVDMQGKIVLNTAIATHINISTLPIGTYKLQIIDAKKRIIGITTLVKN